MKHFVAAVALTLVLSGLAFAGDVPSVGITSTKPDPTQTTATTVGEVPTVGSSIGIQEAALNLIQTLLGIGV
jgi:hypothetical protein